MLFLYKGDFFSFVAFPLARIFSHAGHVSRTSFPAAPTPARGGERGAAGGGGAGAPARYRRKNSGTFWASGPMPEKFPGHFSAWLPGGGDPRGEAGGGQAGHRPPIAEKIRGIFQREAQDRKNSWGIF